MLHLLLLASLAVVVFAGHSPHAEFAKELMTSRSTARYSSDLIEDATLDVPGLVTKYGYPIEVHEVTTPDGYVLTVHRIPHGRDRNNRRDPNKKVVFLMHGLMSSSADFLVLGPGNALGYLLAEEGYDVWLGNARGNYYSRRHTRLNPNSKINQDFWKFSWDEIGNIDLPAILTHIEKTTGQTKYHYIGHSQGGTTFFVLNSLNPEFNEKFISFQGLAPAAFFSNNDHVLYSNLAPYIDIIEPAAFALGRGEIFGSREFISWFAIRYCYEGSVFSPLCTSVVVTATSDYFNTTMIPVFLGHAPAGASIRQFTHYGQGINHDTFRRYDHRNPLTNIRRYGSRTPPDYDLNKVTAPVYIHYSTNDASCNYQDIRALVSKLPNVKGSFLVDSESFDHLDFIWGSGVKDRLYNKVFRLMREAEDN